MSKRKIASTRQIPSLNELCDDILIGIFDHLDIETWLKLCSTSMHYRNLIVNNVISRKLVDFTVLKKTQSAKEVFKLFGKTMTKIKINGRCILRRPAYFAFEQFLQLLLDHCTPGILREVELEFRIPEFIRADLIQRTMPYFQNVQFIKLRSPRSSFNPLRQWFQQITQNQIRTIHLNGMNPFSKNFQLDPFAVPCLQHLILKYCSFNDQQLDLLIDFVKKMPTLKTFHFDGWNMQRIFDTIAEYLPHIESVGKMHVDRIPESTILKMLKRFDNLKHISLFGILDSGLIFNNIFNVLATKSTLKKIEIDIEPAFMGISSIFNYETQMNELIKSNANVQTKYIECLHLTSYFAGDEFWIYYRFLLTKVFDYKICILSFDLKIKSYIIVTIVKHRPNLEQLIVEANVKFSIEFYQQLVEKRQKKSKKPLTIFVETNVCVEWKEKLGNIYNSHVIAIAPKSNAYHEFFLN